MNKLCAPFEEDLLLEATGDGQPPPRTQRHLESCHPCQSRLEQLRQLHEQLWAAPRAVAFSERELDRKVTRLLVGTAPLLREPFPSARIARWISVAGALLVCLACVWLTVRPHDPGSIIASSGQAQELIRGQESAEGTFRKIEESIEKAKSLSVTVALEGWEGSKAHGTLLLKEDGCFSLAVHTLPGTPEVKSSRVSDGTRMSATRGKEDPIVSDVPRAERGSAVTIFARLGAWTMEILMDSSTGKPMGDIKKALIMKDFKEGEDDGDTKTLLYAVQWPGAPEGVGDINCKLWYEPKSHKIRKRKITLNKRDMSWTVVETYSEVLLNKPIPDDKFKIEEFKEK